MLVCPWLIDSCKSPFVLYELADLKADWTWLLSFFNNSNISNLDKENFSTFNANIFSNEINIEKYKYNISPRQNIINIKNRCINFIENFDNPETKNLLFVGNTGLR